MKIHALTILLFALSCGINKEPTSSHPGSLSPNGTVCADGTTCLSGFCSDGVCCDTACGGGDPGDCQACTWGAGGPADGVCGLLQINVYCRPRTGPCDIPERCTGTGPNCPADKGIQPDGAACDLNCVYGGTCKAGACMGSGPRPPGGQCLFIAQNNDIDCHDYSYCDGAGGCAAEVPVPVGTHCKFRLDDPTKCGTCDIYHRCAPPYTTVPLSAGPCP